MILLAPFLPISYSVLMGISILIASACTLSSFTFALIQIFRPFHAIPDWIQQSTLQFSNFTSLLHTTIVLGHIWALNSNSSSFCMGIILSLCDLMVLYLFNYHLLTRPSVSTQAHDDSFLGLAQRYAYMGFSVICILGSKIGSCIMHYQATLLLGLALGFPLSFVSAVAISTATIATLAGLLFSGIQAYELYQRFFPSEQGVPNVPENVAWNP